MAVVKATRATTRTLPTEGIYAPIRTLDGLIRTMQQLTDHPERPQFHNAVRLVNATSDLVGALGRARAKQFRKLCAQVQADYRREFKAWG